MSAVFNCFVCYLQSDPTRFELATIFKPWNKEPIPAAIANKYAKSDLESKK